MSDGYVDVLGMVRRSKEMAEIKRQIESSPEYFNNAEKVNS